MRDLTVLSVRRERNAMIKANKHKIATGKRRKTPENPQILRYPTVSNARIPGILLSFRSRRPRVLERCARSYNVFSDI